MCTSILYDMTCLHAYLHERPYSKMFLLVVTANLYTCLFERFKICGSCVWLQLTGFQTKCFKCNDLVLL